MAVYSYMKQLEDDIIAKDSVQPAGVAMIYPGGAQPVADQTFENQTFDYTGENDPSAPPPVGWA